MLVNAKLPEIEKSRYNIKPTQKQQLVFSMLSENIRSGNVKPIGQVLLDAGYSQSVANSPTRVTHTKGFQELLEEYLPDNLLLDALTQDIKNKPGNRHRELTLALQIKGKLKQAEDGIGGGNTYNTFVQQNNLNPNTPDAKTLVESSLDLLMNQTKAQTRKVIENESN